jgi:catechol 2,3-dioxygenase-like lactoylglutathione lyase family enzyme
MIKNLLHVGIGVHDLERSVTFYTKVMGMEVVYRARNIGERISRVVGVKDAALVVCVVGKGDLRLELIDYNNEEKKAGARHKEQDEPGILHLAFAVTDIDEEYEKIRGLGYEFNAPPTVARENGPKICYFKGPDEVVIELFEDKNSINDGGKTQ